MADMPGFGKMDVNDRGGRHPFDYGDQRDVAASAGQTPSQTIGPFFAYGLTPGPYGYAFEDVHTAELIRPDMQGSPITIEGHVYDGHGAAVHDALVEIFQADAQGVYATQPRNDGFTGYGRYGTGANGPNGDTRFVFRTIKPGETQDGASAFVTLVVTMRGLLNHCITRVYFPEDDHGSDPVMAQVPEDRRYTLIAKKIAADHYRFDVHMQGDHETVFFDL